MGKDKGRGGRAAERPAYDPALVARSLYGRTFGAADKRSYDRALDAWCGKHDDPEDPPMSDAEQRFVLGHLLYLNLQEASASRGLMRRMVRELKIGFDDLLHAAGADQAEVAGGDNLHELVVEADPDPGEEDLGDDPTEEVQLDEEDT